MPDPGYQIPDHGIARAAQALAQRVAPSFYIRGKKRGFYVFDKGLM